MLSDWDWKRAAAWVKMVRGISEKEQVDIVELFWCIWEQCDKIDLEGLR